jgi:hypothetical protein
MRPIGNEKLTLSKAASRQFEPCMQQRPTTFNLFVFYASSGRDRPLARRALPALESARFQLTRWSM